MWSARSDPAPADPLGAARPGAVLVVAGAVPLGVATLLAAGLLPWGARLALGVGLVVLGTRVLALDGTATGARVGGPGLRALGVASMLLGALCGVGAVVAGADGGRLDPLADDFPFLTLGGPGAVLLGLLLIGSAVLARRHPRSGAPVLSATTTALAGAGTALAVVGLLAPGVLHLGADAWSGAVTLLAAAGTAWVVRAPSRAWTRSTGVAAGLLLCVGWGDASGLVPAVLGARLPVEPVGPSAGWTAALVVVAGATAAALLVHGVRRGDPLLALPAGAVLLAEHPVVHGVAQPVLLVVPVVALALAAAGARGRGPVPRGAAAGVGAAALVAGLMAYENAFHGIRRGVVYAPLDSAETTDAGLVGFAIVATVVLLALAVATWRTRGPARAPVALATVLGLAAVQPLALLPRAAPGTVLADPAPIAVLGLLTVAAGAAVARLAPRRGVVLAAAVLAGSSVLGVGYAIAYADPPRDATILVLATLGPVLLGIVAAAALALSASSGRTRVAQAVATGLVLSTASAVLAGSSTLAPGFAGSSGPVSPVIDGTGAVVAVLAILAFVLGLALAAASGTRRPDGPLAMAATVGAAAAAVGVAAVAAGIVGGRVPQPPDLGPALVDSVLGYRTVGSGLALAPGGWPVLLALLGATLVGTGAWLESRRPLPADAPIG